MWQWSWLQSWSVAVYTTYCIILQVNVHTFYSNTVTSWRHAMGTPSYVYKQAVHYISHMYMFITSLPDSCTHTWLRLIATSFDNSPHPPHQLRPPLPNPHSQILGDTPCDVEFWDHMLMKHFGGHPLRYWILGSYVDEKLRGTPLAMLSFGIICWWKT